MAQSTRLKKNQQVKLTDGRTVTVIGKLGEGGQGTVYEVTVDGTNEKRALKWYFIDKVLDPKAFFSNIQSNIDTGSPSPHFIWPEALSEWVNGTFGYIMRIFPREYKSFPKFLNAIVSFSSVEAMVNAALNIVSAFKDLHSKGYNYQDLNDGNFSINPLNGDVMICDNDNVMGYGQSSGVVGKARYIAPEVVRGEKTPDKHTDRFSLSVILFMLLLGSHPLEGSKTNVPVLTSKYDKRFFGTEPLFVFDDDPANRPREGLHQNAIDLWPCLPSYIQDAFKQSFSQDSMLRLQGRLTDLEWLHLMVQLKSSLAKCPHCNEEVFVESKSSSVCIDCGGNISAIGYLKFNKKRSNVEICAPIYEGVVLYDYHMSETSNNYLEPAAKVLVKPGKFGLGNSSRYTWTVTSPKGETVTKSKGEVAPLSLGAKIEFSNDNVAEVISN